MKKHIVSFAFVGLSFLQPFEDTTAVNLPMVSEYFAPKVLAEKSMDLTNRHLDFFVNEVFSDNILLALHYLKGDVPKEIDWQKIRQPFDVEFILLPGEVFAFQDNLLPQFKNKVTKTMKSHFNYTQGYKSDGWLVGDGVCHLASLITWAAKEAHLEVVAPTRHDFAIIPDVPKEYGTSIIWMPDGSRNSQNQNLYIKNSFDFPVKFKFKVNSRRVNLEIKIASQGQAL